MAERLFRFLERADEALTRASFNFWKPIFEVRGVRAQLTESREDRVDFLTGEFRRLAEEQGGLKSIQIAAGSDPDIYAEALERADLIGVEIETKPERKDIEQL